MPQLPLPRREDNLTLLELVSNCCVCTKQQQHPCSSSHRNHSRLDFKAKTEPNRGLRGTSRHQLLEHAASYGYSPYWRKAKCRPSLQNAEKEAGSTRFYVAPSARHALHAPPTKAATMPMSCRVPWATAIREYASVARSRRVYIKSRLLCVFVYEGGCVRVCARALSCCGSPPPPPPRPASKQTYGLGTYLEEAVHVIGHLEDDVTHEGGVGLVGSLRRLEVEEAPHAAASDDTREQRDRVIGSCHATAISPSDRNIPR